MLNLIVFGLSDDIGGVENYLLHMQHELETRVCFHFFVESGNNMHAEKIIQQHGEVVYIPREKGIKHYLRTLQTKLKEYRKTTDLIYLNISNYSHERLAILLWAKRLKYKVIIHCHGAKLNHPIQGVVHKLSHAMIKQASLQLANHCTRLAVSRRAGIFLYGKKSFQILPPGVELKRYQFDESIRKEIRSQFRCDDKLVVGFVGRMVAIKNPSFAIKVIAEICSLFGEEKAILMMVGDGPLLDELKVQVEAAKMQRQVVFVGATNEVHKYLQAMDCMIGTSFSEGMPLAFIEAQASSLPCICAEGCYPDEIAVTDLVTFLSLESGAQVWAKKIIENWEQTAGNANRAERQATDRLMQIDVKSVAQQLYQYLTIVEEGREK